MLLSTIDNEFRALAHGLFCFLFTGWLVTVLSHNFRDVRGFLVVLLAVIVGFSVCFQLLFSANEQEYYGTLRNSLLSTYEMCILVSEARSDVFVRHCIVSLLNSDCATSFSLRDNTRHLCCMRATIKFFPFLFSSWPSHPYLSLS